MVYQSASKNENDVCPECGGQDYNLNHNHYLADRNDYDRRYLICRRCHGTDSGLSGGIQKKERAAPAGEKAEYGTVRSMVLRRARNFASDRILFWK